MTEIASICSRVVSGAASVLPNAASMLFPNLPTSTGAASTTSQSNASPTLTSLPVPHASTSGTGVLAAIVVGAIIGVILLSIIFYVTIRARRRRRAAASAVAPTTSGPGALDVEADSPMSDSRGIVKVFRKLFVDSRVVTHTE
jgi:hypothetical protein